MKELIQLFWEGVYSVLSFLWGMILFAVAVALINIFVIAPYFFLAGEYKGNLFSFPLAIPAFFPLIVLILLRVWVTYARRWGIPTRWTVWSFWKFLFYLLLPIFMNGTSLALQRAGAERVAEIFFQWRYLPLLVVPTVLFGSFVLGLALSKRRESLSEPPPTEPPVSPKKKGCGRESVVKRGNRPFMFSSA